MSNITRGSFLEVVIVIVIFAVMIFLTYLAFSTSEAIMKKLGEHLIMVIGKIMGLILAIMGTGMVIDGIKLAGFDF